MSGVSAAAAALPGEGEAEVPRSRASSFTAVSRSTVTTLRRERSRSISPLGWVDSRGDVENEAGLSEGTVWSRERVCGAGVLFCDASQASNPALTRMAAIQAMRPMRRPTLRIDGSVNNNGGWKIVFVEGFVVAAAALGVGKNRVNPVHLPHLLFRYNFK